MVQHTIVLLITLLAVLVSYSGTLSCYSYKNMFFLYKNRYYYLFKIFLRDKRWPNLEDICDIWKMTSIVQGNR